jgi:large subunit ribosomal protein L7/L12
MEFVVTFLVTSIAVIGLTWIAIITVIQQFRLPHTITTQENRIKQIERQFWDNPTSTQTDRRLAQIERKLDLILYHLDIEIPELEDNDPLPPSPEFCNIILQFVPPEAKISTLRTVRILTGLGLKEAKNLIESTPQIVLCQIPASEAESAKRQLEESGARVILQ